LRDVVAELFALKKALLKSEIDVLRFTRRARRLRKRTRYYLREISRLPEAIGASRVAKNILKSERMMWKFLDDPENIPLPCRAADTALCCLPQKLIFYTIGTRKRIPRADNFVILNMEAKGSESFPQPLIYCFLNRSPE